MLSVTFDTRHVNFLRIDDATYFLLEIGGRRQVLVKDRCPHRGGPLHLACRDATGQKLVCPWHEAHIAQTWLLATSVPMVRVDHHITAFFPVPAETRVQLTQRPILSGQAPADVCSTASDEQTCMKQDHRPAGPRHLQGGSDGFRKRYSQRQRPQRSE